MDITSNEVRTVTGMRMIMCSKDENSCSLLSYISFPILQVHQHPHLLPFFYSF